MLGNLLKKFSSTEVLPRQDLNVDEFDLDDYMLDDHGLNESFENRISPASQLRRERVLEMLNNDPSLTRALMDDQEDDPFNVILTLAIRNVGTVEFLLPKERYNGLAILASLESLQITH